MGSWEKYPLSRQPREIPNFMTIINPIGDYVWIYLIFITLTIALALMTIDKFYSRWNDIEYEDTVYKSNISNNQ